MSSCPAIQSTARVARYLLGGACLLASLGLVSPARAITEYYVATNGTPAGGTNWTTAFTNLQEALAVAATGDIFYLAGHSFGLTTGVVCTVSGVSLHGGYAATNAADTPGPRDSRQWPTVLYRSSLSFGLLSLVGVTNVTLEQLTLAGGRKVASGGAVSCVDGGGGLNIVSSRSVVVDGCIVTGNYCSMDSTYGTSEGGGIRLFASSAAISNTVISENWAKGNSGGSVFGAGLCLNSATVTLDRVVFRGNYAKGSDNNNSPGVWGGALALRSGLAQLRNCRVVANRVMNGNASGGLAGHGLVCTSGVLVVEHGTVAYNAGEGITRIGGSAAATNSILWGNGDDVTGTVTLASCDVEDGDNAGTNGCFSADPLWERGFYLATNSPCADAGTNAVAAWGLTGTTTRVDGQTDSDPVDLGFHYAAGLAAPDLYVAPNGTNTSSGTNWAEAVRSLTTALSRARDGTRIHIAAGSYANGQETFPLRISGWTGVTLEGTNAATTIVTAAGSAQKILVVSADGARIEGLTLTGGNFTSGEDDTEEGGAAVDLCSGTLWINSCSLTGNVCGQGGTYGIAQGGAVRAWLGHLRISDSRIADNRLTACSGGSTYGGGVVVVGARLEAIESLFTGNRAAGSGNNNAVAACGGGVANIQGITRLENCLLNNNVSTNSYASGARGGSAVYSSGGFVVLTHCTVVSNWADGIASVGGSMVVSNSIAWGNGDDVTGTVVLAWSDIEDGDNLGNDGCISEDPLFADLVHYHLLSRYGYYTNGYFHGGTRVPGTLISPCIDAGAPGSPYDREPLPNGRRVNLGAYGNTEVASQTYQWNAGTSLQIW